ncbi:hypothetical protein ACHAXN_004767 [Cyclotella atomus]
MPYESEPVLQEESSIWVNQTIDGVASVTEAANAINMVHDAVLGGKQALSVHAPDTASLLKYSQNIITLARYECIWGKPTAYSLNTP